MVNICLCPRLYIVAVISDFSQAAILASTPPTPILTLFHRRV